MRTSEKILELTLSSNKSAKLFKPRYRHLSLRFSKKHNSNHSNLCTILSTSSKPVSFTPLVCREEEAAMELNILRMHIEDERKLEGV
jgi:hypothetical protein